MLKLVISGGQTGVDQEALYSAKPYFPIGGYCPKGRLSERGKIPEDLPLTETGSKDYRVRTKKNIVFSDGTLILAPFPLTGGTFLTEEWVKREQKPLFKVNLNQDLSKFDGDMAEEIVSWVKSNSISILNVAGPRKSKLVHTDIEKVRKILSLVFKKLNI